MEQAQTAEQQKEAAKWVNFEPEQFSLKEKDITFKTGPLRISKPALDFLNKKERESILYRHVSRDWGEADKSENDGALSNGGRILSMYTIREQSVWILTEIEQQGTSIMLPDDY